MQELSLVIQHEVGLHARPAALFVQKAGKFSSDISIRKATTQSDWINAKSILNVLTLGVEKNQAIDLRINGEDEIQAARDLTTLIESNLAEDQS